MTVASAQELLRRHGIDYVSTKHGKFTTNCPDCNGGYLNVTTENDKVLWYCHSCDAGGSEKYEQVNASSGSDLGPIKAMYDYKDETGKLLFQALRFEPLNQPKQFRQRTGPDQKKWSIKGVRIVPFRLPELIDAVENDRVVFVVEGEKDVLTLASHNIDATCNPMGAGKWRAEFGKAFEGADVVICGDNDAPGRDHVLRVVRGLAPVARCVRVLDLKTIWPEIEESDDISDWFAAGGTVEALLEHIGQLDPVVEPSSDGEPPPWEQPIINGKANGHGKDEPPAPLTIDDWLNRKLPEPDWLIGHWFSTTSRVIASAPTGIGKTMLGMRLSLAMAAGVDFLHWHGVRRANVLLIDGEMSRRLIKSRLAQEVERSALRPAGMHLLNHEDIANFLPLNTPEGQAQIEAVIKRIVSTAGKLDAIVFDNVMSLIAGDMKDEEAWNKVIGWIKNLTRRQIGQLWLHHTGHDETRGYGTKTREWQMDAVIHLEKFEHPETDVAFRLRFKKAREREPATRADFADMSVTLIRDQWSAAPLMQDMVQGKKLSPLARKFYEALCDTIAESADKVNGRQATNLSNWRAYCVKRGLLDDEKNDSARAQFSKNRTALVTADKIVCENGMVWIVDHGFNAQRTMGF